MDYRKVVEQIERQSTSLLAQDRTDKAIAVVREAIEAAVTAFGNDSPYTTYLKDHLADIFLQLERPDEAAALGEETLEAKYRALGPIDFVAQSANNLAEIYRKSGRLTRARALYLEALEIAEHPVIWNNLGLLYSEIGDLENAERCISNCLEADLEEFGLHHPNTAITQDNLASVLVKMAESKDDEVASQLQEEALLLMDSALETFRHEGRSQTLLECLANRTENLIKMNRLDEAVEAGLEGDELAQWLAPQSVVHIAILLSLSKAYLANRQEHEAIPTLESVLAMKPTVASTAHSTELLAECYMRQNRFADAAHALAKALGLDQQIMANRIGTESEAGRIKLCRTPWTHVNKLISICLHSPDILSVADVLELVLRWKDLQTDMEHLFAKTARQAADPAVVEGFTKIRDHQRVMVEASLMGPDVEITPFLEQVDEQERFLLLLEGELANLMESSGEHKSLETNILQWLDTITITKIAQNLPAGSILVFYLLASVKKPDDDNYQRYLAFTLAKTGSATVIDIGAADVVDSLIEQSSGLIYGRSRNVVLVSAKNSTVKKSAVLKQLILDPIFELDPTIKHLIIAPDAKLWMVPFDALPLADDRYVIDEYTISYVRSAREIGHFDRPVGPYTQPIVLGDPDYSMGQELFTIKDLIVQLPGTRVECRQIAKRLGVSPIEGADACKSIVTNATSPVILHLATHGVYDVEAEFQLQRFSPMPWRQMSTSLIGNDYHDRLQLWERNPMFRSMLLFAGVSAFLDGHASQAVENGILTAAELMLVDLEHTELVVLSACVTLRGETTRGNVRGLSSALTQAGAKTAVLSLWPVPDEMTQILMDNFYRYLLQGTDRAEALRQAKLDLRSEGAGVGDWAAFSCLGKPGPLPPQVLVEFS